VGTVNVINRTAVVLLCAHLEGYLEELAVDFVDCLSRNAKSASDIPLAIRVVHFTEAAGGIMGKRLEILNSRDTLPVEEFFAHHAQLWGGPLHRPITVLDPTLLTADMSNPSGDRIRKFVGQLGVSNAFRPIRGSPYVPRADGLRETINDMVRKRHAIAHGEAGTPDSLPTSGDVRRYFVAVMRLALRTEHQLTKILEPICAPNAVW